MRDLGRGRVGRCPDGAGGVSWTWLLTLPASQPLPRRPPLKACSAPGRQLGLELLQSRLQKEHELNLKGSYHSPLLGTLTYTVPR